MEFAMYTLFSKIARTDGWETATDTAKSFGCTYIETLDNTDASQKRLFNSIDDAYAAQHILERKGLKAACCSVFTNLYKNPDAVNSLKFQAETTAALGSPFLHHTLLPWFESQDGLPEFDEAMEIAIDAAEEIAKHAEKFGITCIYEDQGFYINGIDNYRIFIEEMKRRCSNVGVCGDMGNCMFDDTSGEDFFKAFKKDIKHVHAKDYFQKHTVECPGKGWFRSKKGVWLADAPMGEGVINISSCMDILKHAGYRGPISIESSDVSHSINYLKNFDM